MARFGTYYNTPLAICGCWYVLADRPFERQYLPQITLDSSTTILTRTSRTRLVQTFSNNQDSAIPEAQYTFPLYDGVSVVSFTCTVGDRTIVGVVKEKQQARTDYTEAVARGETAGLLEQLPEAGDVFTTKIGNIPAGGTVSVEIVYIGELKHDTETDGARFTIPTVIAPRYGSISSDSTDAMTTGTRAVNSGGIKISVDIAVQQGSSIRGVQSPSHPIAVTLGRNADHDEDVFQNNLASATLSLAGKTELDKDFVIIVKAQDQDTPCALLEHHTTLENQRALMTTLVPKFNLPNAHPEIVFVVDRSGSMEGKMQIVTQALKIFLKSLPTSVKFNICSFGSHHTFLFSQSKPYDQSSLKEALAHADTLQANYGGTEILKPIQQCLKQRLGKTPLEIMLLTDGEVWNQDELFKLINKAAKDKVRVFSLGIGSGASSSLVEGMARAGNGFAQFVDDGEQIDKRVIRMLKAALTPFVSDYSLEVVYKAEGNSEEDDDFEVIESFTESLKAVVSSVDVEKKPNKLLSLFTSGFKEEAPKSKSEGRYDHLPTISTPKILQAPHQVPQLYSFSRTTIYLLFGPDSCAGQPQKVVLRGTTDHGELMLEIPVEDVGRGQTIHQLAAKKASQDLEEGRGWLTEAKTDKDKPLKTKYEGDWERIIEREAVRLGTKFQVAGKYCSFVAVEQERDQEKAIPSTMKPPGDSLTSSGPKVGWTSTPFQSDITSPADVIMYSGSKDSSTSTPFQSSVKAKRANLASRGGSGLFSLGRSQAAYAGPPAPSPAPPPYRAAALMPDLCSAPSGRKVWGVSPIPPAASATGFGSAAPLPPPPPGGAAPPPPPSRRTRESRISSEIAAKPQSNAFDPAIRQESAAPFFGSSLQQQPRPQGHSMEAKKSTVGGDKVYSSNTIFSRQGVEEDLIDYSDEEMESQYAYGDPSIAAKRDPTSPESIMHAVIGLQEFDGSWTQVESLLSTIGISQQDFNAATGLGESDTVKATILAVAWLEKVMAKEKDTWEMVADKARAWVAGQGGAQDAGSMIEAAKAAFFVN